MTQSLLREYIRRTLRESVWDADYTSPPKIFRDQTGIDVVHQYKLPARFTSAEQMQAAATKWVEADEAARSAAWDAWDENPVGDLPLDADHTPVEVKQELMKLTQELIKLNPELRVATQATSADDAQDAMDIIFGVASHFPPDDIAHYISGAISKDSARADEIRELTGVHAHWVLSQTTADRIVAQAQQMTENAEDLNEPFADAETLEELFGLGVGRPHKTLSPVQSISSNVAGIIDGVLNIVLTLVLSDRDGDGIPDIADVEPDVAQYVKKQYPNRRLSNLEQHLHNTPGHMYLRGTLT